MAALTEQQTMLKDQVESWVIDRAPVQAFRQLRDTINKASGSDQETNQLYFSQHSWQEIAEMGWAGIIIPEQYGGLGLDYLTFGIVLEQLGRQLTASPLFASALVGATAILLAGNETQKHLLLPSIADGSTIVVLALEEGARHRPQQIALQAQTTKKGFSLTGRKTFVPEGMAADTLIVAARSSGEVSSAEGISLFLVAADSAGISRQALRTVDSRGYATIDFDNVQVASESLLGTLGEANPILEATLDRARAGISAEMLGTAAQSFDMTLDYLKTRKQFGKVIGSFQALGHRAADLFSQQELTRSCVEAALQAIDSKASDVNAMCSLAKCKSGDLLHKSSNELIQMHGGIGMADEFDAGLFLKRARVLEASYGNQAYHRNRYAKLKGF